jgi:hypothetical protein
MNDGPRVIKLRAKNSSKLLAATTRQMEELTTSATCERVLVVYERNAASLYVEKRSPERAKRAR